mmetsp:Transcript_53306/g.88566  ORF Transcript_53306/g.88566 Transcript_53306/m.88566 type:complete len:296 (+) Transcript_53306:532-1419(+)
MVVFVVIVFVVVLVSLVHLIVTVEGRVRGVVVDLFEFTPGGAVDEGLFLSLVAFDDAKGIAVERAAEFVDGGLSPLATRVAKAGAGRDGRVEARDAEGGVRRRRAIALHVDQPRRRDKGTRAFSRTHAESLTQFFGEVAGSSGLDIDLELLALIVELAVARELGLGLVLEEGVVEDFVVDVDLAHLGLRSLTRLLLHRLTALLVHDRLADLADAGALDKVRKTEGRLLDTTLALEVLSTLAPVTGHGHSVSVGLEEQEVLGVLAVDVMQLDEVWPGDSLLEDGDLLDLQLLEFLL